MTPAPLRFRPRWWAAALAAAGCGAGILLGNWQAGRAAEKRVAATEQTRVALRGVLLAGHTVFLDNRFYRGRPGFHVVQPLRIASGQHVLVNRGWIAAAAQRDLLPEVATPAQEVAIEGVRLARFPRVLGEATPAAGRIWQNLTHEAFAAHSGLRLEPYAVEQHSPLADGLVRDWPRADVGADKNLSYALQWYSLAALCVVLFLVLSFRRDVPAA